MDITESDLFYGLDFKVMDKIADMCSEEHNADGAVIFKEGENTDNLYTLEEGITGLLIGEDTLKNDK